MTDDACRYPQCVREDQCIYEGCEAPSVSTLDMEDLLAQTAETLNYLVEHAAGDPAEPGLREVLRRVDALVLSVRERAVA